MRLAGASIHDLTPPMAYLTLAFISLLWGTSFLLIKIAAAGLTPLGFAAGRIAIGALTLVALALAAGWPWPRGRRQWGRLTLLSALGQAAPMLALGLAAHLTTSADMALMMGAAPMSTMVLARLIGAGEMWSLEAGIGLGLGLVGVVLALAAPVDPGLYPHAALGRGLALAAAVLYAAAALLARDISHALGPAMTATLTMTISAGFLIVADGLFGPRSDLTAAPPGSLAALLALGVFNTALANLVYYRLVERSGATFATLNNYFVPFVGLILGATLMGERITLLSWLGLGFVVLGVAVTGLANRRWARAERRPRQG